MVYLIVFWLWCWCDLLFLVVVRLQFGLDSIDCDEVVNSVDYYLFLSFCLILVLSMLIVADCW